MIKGVDVSDHQGVIDWAAVQASGIDYAIIRCGIGSDEASQDDAQYLRNVAECQRLGIPYGVYLYSYAITMDDAHSELQHLLRLLQGTHPTYPVYIDMEDADGYKMQRGGINAGMCVDICDYVCRGLEAAGYYAGIYANLYWLNTIINDSKLDRYDKWVAQWGPDSCTYAGDYGMWQYTSDGIVPGIGGRVDCNYAYRDYPAIIAGSSHTQPTPAPAEPLPDVTYAAYTDHWLPAVVNCNDDTDDGYAGVPDAAITGLWATLSRGNITYRVHLQQGGEYLPWVTNQDAAQGGYAGIIDNHIDGLQMYIDLPGYAVEYRVATQGGAYLPWVHGYGDGDDGYAGIYGCAIDRVQIRVVKEA